MYRAKGLEQGFTIPQISDAQHSVSGDSQAPNAMLCLSWYFEILAELGWNAAVYSEVCTAACIWVASAQVS